MSYITPRNLWVQGEDIILNYRSISDLNRLIIENVHRIPHDVDLIVGIPRSGMLVANLLALHSNKQLTDVEGYIEGRFMSSGLQRAKIGRKLSSISECRRALVIDDSLLTGAEMRRVRSLVSDAGLIEKTIFAAAICIPGKENDVDIVFDLCPTPRVFEWNLMHGHILPKCCVDIDGVLCIDPTEEQNDDGPNYRKFLTTAKPLWKPTAKIGILVTSRLKKYRNLTEIWLAEQEIKYEKLEMMAYETMAERQEAKAYGSYKAKIYAQSDMIFFVESSDTTSKEIAKLSGKPALCIETHVVYDPSGISYAKQKFKNTIQETKSLKMRVIRKLRKLCF